MLTSHLHWQVFITPSKPNHAIDNSLNNGKFKQTMQKHRAEMSLKQPTQNNELY